MQPIHDSFCYTDSHDHECILQQYIFRTDATQHEYYCCAYIRDIHCNHALQSDNVHYFILCTPWRYQSSSSLRLTGANCKGQLCTALSTTNSRYVCQLVQNTNRYIWPVVSESKAASDQSSEPKTMPGKLSIVPTRIASCPMYQRLHQICVWPVIQLTNN